MEIRNGTTHEVEKFQLFSEENEGNEILVVEHEGEIVAFAQITGSTIFFMESNMKGAGTAIVEHLKAEHDYLVADSTDKISEGFWMKMGFERCTGGYGLNKNFDWYAE